MSMVEVAPEELVPGDIVVRIRELEPCCGHTQLLVTVSRSPYSKEAEP